MSVPIEDDPLNGQAVGDAGQGAPSRILVADDSAETRDYVGRLLAGRYAVEVVADGAAALAAAGERPPDLILSDVLMPELDGLGLLRAIRADARLRTTPVVLLSGRDDEEARVAGLEAGADDYLVKPFSARELLARVGAHLEMAHLRRETTRREQQLHAEADAARDRLEKILGSISNLFLTLDCELRFTYANDRAVEVTGIPREKLLGRRLLEVFPDAAGAALETELRRALEQQTPVHFEYCHAALDRWFENRAYPSPEGVSVFSAEITERKRAEEALRDSEERYRDLFENANDIIYTLDLETRITSINRRAEGAFGYTREECLGLPAARLVPPEYHDRMADALRRKLEGGGAPTTYELEVICKDGRRVPMEVSSRLIVRGGRPVGVQGIARDITERKRAEAERERLLRELEAERAFLAAVLQQMPGGVVIAEAPSGRIVFGNVPGPALPPPDTVEEGPFGGLVPGRDAPVPEDWPLFRSLRLGEVVRGEEIDYRKRDGSRGTLRASSTPVRDAQGHVIAAVATWSDVTERRRAEEAQRFLAEAGEALAASLDPDVTLKRVAQLAVPTLADWCAADVILDDGSVRRVAVVHRDPAKVELARQLRHRYPPGLQTPEGRAIVQGDPVLIPEITEEHLTRYARDADHLAVLRQLGLRSTILLPLAARGRLVGAISLVSAESGRRYGPADLALARELARRAALAVDNARLYRELRDADRRKDEFLAMLAHELRNPLAPIRNAVQVLKMLGGPQPRGEAVHDIIERQVTHLVRLVDDLLDVSRITRGQVLLRKERLDLVPLVGAAAEDRRPLLEGTGLRLAMELPDHPLWVEGDPTRLAQVVGNLLHNAHKFTDAGGLVTVRLRADGDRGVLTVRDTGIGMEAEMLRRLFEPFSQADRSIDRSRGGLGLGLALVKGLAELHGGTVGADSDGPGHGSAFTVTLPLVPEPESEGTAPDRPRRGKSLRILIVEDNHDAAESLRLLLQMSGHEVEVAHTGAAALEAARKQRPDVVLCDIGLPGSLDGHAVARALRADPEQTAAVLIALSGYGQEEDQRQARQAGFDRHLTKPVDPLTLTRLLETLPVRTDR
jgi:PAS domain S-box-containing protein